METKSMLYLVTEYASNGEMFSKCHVFKDPLMLISLVISNVKESVIIFCPLCYSLFLGD